MNGDSAVDAPKLSKRLADWARKIGLARKLAVALALMSLAAALVTYAALSGTLQFGTDARIIPFLLSFDLILFLLLFAVVARGLVSIWIARRRGSVGSRLHTRLVFWFSVVALAPAIIVSVFSAVFFSFVVQAWFSETVRTALSESQHVADSYLIEHQRSIRGDILAMARDLNRTAPQLFIGSAKLNRFLATQGMIRNLSEAYVFNSRGRVLAQWNPSFVLDHDPVPLDAMERARSGELVLLTSETDDRLRAIVKLNELADMFLYVGRFVEPRVLNYIERTRRAVAQYKELEGRRSSVEITFAMVFVLVALLLLLAAIWVGLSFATRLVRPITDLATAAERVRSGDLSARVEVGPESDEIGSLSRAFNRMTGQLDTQHNELMEANRQLEGRRHFMETVLFGVSAGVIGLDADGRINLPNRSASDLLSVDMEAQMGDRLIEVVPEFAELLAAARRMPDRMAQAQISMRRDGRVRMLLVRIVADRTAASDGKEAKTNGFVVTIDDVTALLSAQRKAAWSDVARRIAHEIKNPLTPIQLSAERLHRKYLKEIKTDPEIFSMCTDTIVRHVEDIGRMVDEFSSFARMPEPVMVSNNLTDICKRELALQRSAYPNIDFQQKFSDEPFQIICDQRQIGQALTNLLQNAIDSFSNGDPAGDQRISVDFRAEGDMVVITVVDNGKGLPEEERDRLTEPYVTTREKGTGLGLAIVRKIMEDHGGEVLLEDDESGGAKVSLVLSARVKGKEMEDVGRADHAVPQTTEIAGHGV